MHIDYFYNEKLPKRTAHDAYVWRSCYFLSQKGHDVSLITGKSAQDLVNMQQHYLPATSFESIADVNMDLYEKGCLGAKAQSILSRNFSKLTWVKMPLLRKSSFLNLSWNLPFFIRCQKWLERRKPDWALFSVYKQALYHLKRKIPGVSYGFEVHDLAWYPQNGHDTTSWKSLSKLKNKQLQLQIQVLRLADCITVTTQALQKILSQAPYSIHSPIYIVPLASEHSPICRSLPSHSRVRIAYVGQLYEHQGVGKLIEAAKRVPQLYLEIIGGSTHDLDKLKILVDSLAMSSRVRLRGFVPPSQVAPLLQDVHALAAPFYPTPHMKHVAHTKLADYGRWALPVVAPKLECVVEHVWTDQFLFSDEGYPQSTDSLVETLNKLVVPGALEQSYSMIDQLLYQNFDRFSWEDRCSNLTRALYKSLAS